MQDSLFQPAADRHRPLNLAKVFNGRVLSIPSKRQYTVEEATAELRRFLMQKLGFLAIQDIVCGPGEWIEVFALEQWGSMSAEATQAQMLRITPEDWLSYPVYVVFVKPTKS